MKVFVGSFIHCKSLEELDILHDAAVFVDEKGQIKAVVKDIKEPQDDAALKATFTELGWNESEVSVMRAKKGQFFFPGFIGMYS